MRHPLRPLWTLLAALPAFTLPALAQAGEHLCPDFLAKSGAAEPEYRNEFSFSPYTYHWTYSSEHKPVVMATLSENLPGGRLCGVSVFSK